MAKTRKMIGVCIGSKSKQNWIGSAHNKKMADALIEAHIDATGNGKKKSDYVTFSYTDDPEKLSSPFDK